MTKKKKFVGPPPPDGKDYVYGGVGWWVKVGSPEMVRTKMTEMVKLTNQKVRSGKEGRGGPEYQSRKREEGIAAAAGKVIMSGNVNGGEKNVVKIH